MPKPAENTNWAALQGDQLEKALLDYFTRRNNKPADLLAIRRFLAHEKNEQIKPAFYRAIAHKGVNFYLENKDSFLPTEQEQIKHSFTDEQKRQLPPEDSEDNHESEDELTQLLAQADQVINEANATNLSDPEEKKSDNDASPETAALLANETLEAQQRALEQYSRQQQQGQLQQQQFYDRQSEAQNRPPEEQTEAEALLPAVNFNVRRPLQGQQPLSPFSRTQRQAKKVKQHVDRWRRPLPGGLKFLLGVLLSLPTLGTLFLFRGYRQYFWMSRTGAQLDQLSRDCEIATAYVQNQAPCAMRRYIVGHGN